MEQGGFVHGRIMIIVEYGSERCNNRRKDSWGVRPCPCIIVLSSYLNM